MHVKLILGIVAAVMLLYVAVAAYLLRFQMDRVLFPATSASRFTAAGVERVASASGNELLVRRYGAVERGCIVFFPGQHGNLPGYEEHLFPTLTAQGVAVFSLAYPGQDGAAGRSGLAEIRTLTAQALAVVGGYCKLDITVFVGRSLGAMLAAYAVNDRQPAGVVLDSTASSLSAAVGTQLKSHWASLPLAYLPLSTLLPHDYSLAEALARAANLRVVIFQGTNDTQTLLSDLYEAKVLLPRGITLIPIPGADHSDAYVVAGKAYFDAIFSMFDKMQEN